MLALDAPLEERRKRWLGAFDHYMRKDSKREHKEELEAAQTQLRDFLKVTADYIEKIRGGFGTQLCESVNAIKARMAPKTVSWKCSWIARMAAAILTFNEGHTWKWHWPEISGRCRRRLEAEFAKNARQAEASSSRRPALTLLEGSGEQGPLIASLVGMHNEIFGFRSQGLWRPLIALLGSLLSIGPIMTAGEANALALTSRGPALLAPHNGAGPGSRGGEHSHADFRAHQVL
jgi:hypothetical protein